MNDLTRRIQITFVVETNECVRSDNAYIVWMLKKSFEKYIVEEKCEELFIYYDFVYMDGKPNYCKKRVKYDIKSSKDNFVLGNKYVVYCIDIDTQGKDEKLIVESIKEFVRQNGYYLVVSYREIEDVMRINLAGSKSERVKHFLSHYPKKDCIGEKCLSVPIEKVFGNVGKTNFNLVIEEIIRAELKKR